ncbi:MAG: MBL fold metallo-hydrolase [Tatlockia sp.]|jgi:ribonuclease Z
MKTCFSFFFFIGCSFNALSATENLLNDTPKASRASWAPLGEAYGKNYSTSNITKVVMLGTGTPTPDTRHGGISVAIIVNNQSYIFDVGPGFWRSSAAMTPAWGGPFPALDAKNIKTLFLTHLHADHTEGLPSFILSPWGHDRTTRPSIYGPPGTIEMVHDIEKAYQKTIGIELFGLEHLSPAGWKAEVHEIYPGKVYQDANILVEAFANHHGTWDYSYGYRIKTPDRLIVLSGDTSPFKEMLERYQGADILIHEAYSIAGFNEAKFVNKPYMQSFHTSTQQLAGILSQSKPGVTVLYHFKNFTSAGNPHADDELGVQEIKKYGYQGKVIQSQDGDIY